MSTRTDALLSQQETGKITASISPCCVRLSPGAGFQRFAAFGVPPFKLGNRHNLAEAGAIGRRIQADRFAASIRPIIAAAQAAGMSVSGPLPMCSMISGLAPHAAAKAPLDRQERIGALNIAAADEVARFARSRSRPCSLWFI